MKIHNKFYLLWLIAFSSLCYSCNSWLDVDSEDRIIEDRLFETKDGFMSLLNGVYLQLLDDKMYGDNMTCGAMDVLANYYNCGKSDHTYNKLSLFNEEDKRKIADDYWEKAYFTINNINTLIEHCDAQKDVLSTTYKNVVKGECLALRAFLHFDLLRVFGPIYSVNSDQASIPYHLNSELRVQPLLTASKVIELVNEDLLNAENLLKESDPVITNGVMYSEDIYGSIHSDLRYRSNRLNYYAVLALSARVALYSNNLGKANRYAKDVITAAQNWFPFVTREQASAIALEDRVYHTEILWGASHSARENIFNNHFSNKLELSMLLTPLDKNCIAMYEGDINDFRYAHQWETMDDVNTNTYKFFVKYMSVPKEKIGYGYILPLIRVSEMYLIAAETESDKTTAYGYLNKIRNNRGIANKPETGDLSKDILDEYRREFIGEGQLFWYYKRLKKDEIHSGNKENAMIDMLDDYYLFTLPQAETDLRN